MLHPAIFNALVILLYAAFDSFIINATAMKFIGFLLLLTGWVIALSAIVMLPRPGARAAFMLAGVAVELLGLALVTREHLLQIEASE
jgi:hypothetical protein